METRFTASATAFIPSGYKKLLYKLSKVSFGFTGQVFCNKIGPVSRPSSAQKIERPATLSPLMSVLLSTHSEF